MEACRGSSVANRPRRRKSSDSNHSFPFSRSPFSQFTCFPLLFFTLLVLACGHAPPGRGAGEIESTSQKGAETRQVKFRVETVVGNLEVPWAIVLAPDGRMLFTERSGRVRVFPNGE